MNRINIKNTLYDFTVFLCFFVLISSVLLSAFTVKGEITANDISSRLIRLHVLAQSDSQEDQDLKLKVRTAVLDESVAIFDDCTDIEQAKKLCKENLSRLENAAQSVIDSEGFLYEATVEFDIESYPVRRYEDFTLPSGKYLSLRVVIGEGNGKNWWCVLYPPLCTSYASRTVSSDKKLLSKHGFSQNEIAILEEGTPEKGKIVLKSYIFDAMFK